MIQVGLWKTEFGLREDIPGRQYNIKIGTWDISVSWGPMMGSA